MAQGDIDPLSPTAQIQAYLQSQGLPLTAQNVHNVLMANAMGTGGAGQTLPGVVNQAPPSEDVGVGRGGNVARKVEGGSARNPGGADLSHVPNEDEQKAAQSGDRQTSAQPGPNISVSGGPSVGDMITLGLPALGAAGAGYGAYRYMRGRGVGDSVGPMPDIDPALSGDIIPPRSMVAANDVGVGGRQPPTIDVPPQPQAQMSADQYRLLPDQSSASPMEIAMQRAIQGPGAPQLSGINPVTNPADIIAAQGRMPPGVSPTDVVNANMPGLGDAMPLQTAPGPKPPEVGVRGPASYVPGPRMRGMPWLRR